MSVSPKAGWMAGLELNISAFYLVSQAGDLIRLTLHDLCPCQGRKGRRPEEDRPEGRRG